MIISYFKIIDLSRWITIKLKSWPRKTHTMSPVWNFFPAVGWCQNVVTVLIWTKHVYKTQQDDAVKTIRPQSTTAMGINKTANLSLVL